MGMQERAFRPLGPTVNMAVTAGAVAIALPFTLGTRAVRIVNAGTTTIWVNFGDTTAVVTAATTTQSMPMLGNTVEVFTVQVGTNAASIISTGAAGTAYLTAGEGL